jgi:osmotically inducible lipoprotein OsmB
MIRVVQHKRILAALLIVTLMLGTFGSLSACTQRRRYNRYSRSRHSKTKGAVIGAAVGLIGGALIGGKKGALIGAGAGAGTGYLIQRRRNQRRNRRYYRRY